MDGAARGGRRLVGRGAELTLIGDRVASLAAGRGGVCWLTGDSGVGKSALLAAAEDLATQAGCLVLRGDADELYREIPLGAILNCLDTRGRSSARPGDPAGSLLGDLLAPAANVPAAVDAVAARREAVLALIDRLTSEQPVALVVDDFHFADDASLALWSDLLRSARQAPLLLISASWPAEPGGALAAVQSMVEPPDQLQVLPLPPADAVAVATALLAAPAGPRLAAALERGQGNPFYVSELVEGLLRDGRITISAGSAELDGDPDQLPDSLFDAIGDRLGSVSPAAGGTLTCAAILGPDFSPAELYLLVETSPDQTDALLQEGVRAGLLLVQGAQLHFRHPLIRSSLVQGAPVALRQALHRQVAQALADTGAPAQRVAAHLLAGPAQIDDWARQWLAGSAAVLSSRAPEVACALLQRALGDDTSHGPAHKGLAAALARVSFQLGQHDLVLHWAGVVMADSGPEAQEMTWLRVYSLMRTGSFPLAQSVAKEALEGALTGLWLVRLRALYAMLLAALGDLAAAHDQAQRALTDGEAAGDHFAVGYALHALSTLTRQRSATQSVEYVEQALKKIDFDPEVADLRLLLLGNAISFLAHVGRGEDARRRLAEALILAETAGVSRRTRLRTIAAQLACNFGWWDDAVAEIAAAAEDPMTDADLATQNGIAAWIAVHRDDMEAAQRHIQAAEQALAGTGARDSSSAWARVARAAFAERSGDPQQAVASLRDVLDVAEVGLHERTLELVMLTRASLLAGQRDVAVESLAAADADAEADPSAKLLAASLHCRALVEATAEPLRMALRHYESAGYLLETTQAREDLAVLLAAQGSLDEARAVFNEAVDGYAALEAEWDLHRVDARLRAWGIRRGARGSRQRSGTGWGALTPTETKIARCVGAGMSNPDIAARLLLSRSTVRTHVSHVLAKLNATARGEVAAWVARADEEEKVASR